MIYHCQTVAIILLIGGLLPCAEAVRIKSSLPGASNTNLNVMGASRNLKRKDGKAKNSKSSSSSDEDDTDTDTQYTAIYDLEIMDPVLVKATFYPGFAATLVTTPPKAIALATINGLYQGQVTRESLLFYAIARICEAPGPESLEYYEEQVEGFIELYPEGFPSFELLLSGIEDGDEYVMQAVDLGLFSNVCDINISEMDGADPLYTDDKCAGQEVADADLPPDRRFLQTDKRFFSCGALDLLHTLGSQNVPFINVLEFAAGLSYDVYYEPPILWYVEEGTNAGLVTFRDGICYAAYRGTTISVADWSSNVEVGEAPICPGSGSCCSVRTPYAIFAQALSEMVDDCMNANANAALVITGHSQGGAHAVTGGIMFERYDPYIITFGQPGVMMTSALAGCKDTLRGANGIPNLYRVINTDAEALGKGIDYDPVPDLHFFTSHLGQVIVLADTDNRNVAYFPDESTAFDYGQSDYDISAHMMDSYLSKIGKLATNSMPSTPGISSKGWVNNEFCNIDAECKYGKCISEHCTAGYPGQTCDDSSDCVEASFCDRQVPLIGNKICIWKYENGDWCSKNYQCESYCDWTWHCI